jgi:hypothetical protein
VKLGLRNLAVLLAILGAGDLIMVPFMIEANHHAANAIPPPAIVLGAVLGIATLASIRGVTQGRRWAFRVMMICRILDTISSVLGIVGGPSGGFVVVGAVNTVLCVAAIVAMVRLNPRRALRRAASGT